MSEIQLVVLLEPDEDDPSVFRASVPGLPGCICALGSPQAALRATKAALRSLVLSMGRAELATLREQQRAFEPRTLSKRSSVERVSVRTGFDLEPAPAPR